MAGATMPFRFTRRHGAVSTAVEAALRRRSVPLYATVIAVRFNSAYAPAAVEAWIDSNREARDLWLRPTVLPLELSSVGCARFRGRVVRRRGEYRPQDRKPRGSSRRSSGPRAAPLARGAPGHSAGEGGRPRGAWEWHNAALATVVTWEWRTIIADRLQAVAAPRSVRPRGALGV